MNEQIKTSFQSKKGKGFFKSILIYWLYVKCGKMDSSPWAVGDRGEELRDISGSSDAGHQYLCLIIWYPSRQFRFRSSTLSLRSQRINCTLLFCVLLRSCQFWVSSTNTVEMSVAFPAVHWSLKSKQLKPFLPITQLLNSSQSGTYSHMWFLVNAVRHQGHQQHQTSLLVLTLEEDTVSEVLRCSSHVSWVRHCRSLG